MPTKKQIKDWCRGKNRPWKPRDPAVPNYTGHHAPRYQYDCDHCKFSWCCGPTCSCVLNLQGRRYPPPPPARQAEVDAAVRKWRRERKQRTQKEVRQDLADKMDHLATTIQYTGMTMGDAAKAMQAMLATVTTV